MEREVKVDYGSHSPLALARAAQGRLLPGEEAARVGRSQGNAAGAARGLKGPLWLSPKEVRDLEPSVVK